MLKIIHLQLNNKAKGTYWDHTFLLDCLEGLDSNRVVVIIPGAYQWNITDEINRELAKYKKVLVFVTSDEECKFDIKKLKHSNMIVYSQYNNGGKLFPLGYPPNTRKILKEIGLVKKQHDWFFAGQINCSRRKMMVEELKKRKNGRLYESKGFAQGLDQQQYLYTLACAKTAICPPGHVAIDSFRLYEALEAGCNPIVDSIGSLDSSDTYFWEKLFGDVGFSTFTDYKKMPTGKDSLAWWINKKYQIRQQFKRDLGIKENDIAAIIPVSPIKSHPSTRIIDETIKSIRHHLDCPILVTMDGVRKEQEKFKTNYMEFQKRFLWKCNFEYKDVLPVVFNKHTHQAGMMKVVLKNINIPYILYVEHDTPLTKDKIPWNKLKKYIKSKQSNLIRFYFENQIIDEHKHLMVGKPENEFLKTIQWSQRPHLASIEYYKQVMSNFSDKSNTFIEDKMHGIVQTQTWKKNKLCIYHPKENIRRSYHLDGRSGEKKYDDRLIY